MYSPLHYSTQAHPTSDGESDTVSAPMAHQPGPFRAKSPKDRWGNRFGAGGASLGFYCEVARGVSILGLCLALIP